MENGAFERAVDTFASYIRSGIKKVRGKALGVEVEHFILDRETLVSTPYAGAGGVREILEELIKRYPGAEPIIGEDLLGFSVPEFNITLEPAAQIEISIAAGEDIDTIGGIYTGFYDNLTEIASHLNKKIVCVGCQPVSNVDDLPLIPKGRYRLMDEHFKKTGTGGRQMMRGTASAQASIDYFSEEDFRRKLQTAYFYTPLFKLMSDRVESFQDEKVNVRLKRTDIWNRTDPARCGILPGVFKDDYGFEDYARYVCQVPLIFVPENGGERYTGYLTAPEIFADRDIGEKEIEHIFSMPFPDVRVKRYLEIRGADSMPLEGVLSLCALIKGLLYSEDVLDYVQMCIKSRGLDEDSIRATEESLMNNGLDGEIYGVPAREFVSEAYEMCAGNLTDRERELLRGWSVE